MNRKGESKAGNTQQYRNTSTQFMIIKMQNEMTHKSQLLLSDP